MNYLIPTDEQIIKALEKVLKKYRTVQTQRKLRKLVSEELDTKKEKYGISQAKLRNIAINSDFVKLEIHSREGDPKKIMNRCPVCKHVLKKVKNQTIWGGKVTLEFKCPHCSYWTGKKKRIPTKYVFHFKKR